jgi:hypothetical protein
MAAKDGLAERIPYCLHYRRAETIETKGSRDGSGTLHHLPNCLTLQCRCGQEMASPNRVIAIEARMGISVVDVVGVARVVVDPVEDRLQINDGDQVAVATVADLHVAQSLPIYSREPDLR